MAVTGTGPWRAPDRWRSIEFVSDLHLCPQAPRTQQAFLHYLADTDTDALFVLGDLFEVWIGDDTMGQPFERECLAALAAFAEHRELFFIAGNRDFLLGPAALAAAGMTALADPTRLDAFGIGLLLSHGDALCLDDTDYQAFRRMVRGQAWQGDFLARPLQERAALAGRIRAESQGRKASRPDPRDWADVDPQEARRWLDESGASVLVHGHTHRPGRESLGERLERRVLSDWDHDATPARGGALRLDGCGWHLRPPPS